MVPVTVLIPTLNVPISVDPAGVTMPVHETSQSPAVSEADDTLTAVPVVSDTPVKFVGVATSPTLPAFALAPFVIPTMLGWRMVGLVPKTTKPVPVSSEMTPANCADVVAENCESGLPVFGIVVQAGAVDAPVETIAWPAVDPVGLSSWIGLRVVAFAAKAENAKTHERSFFMEVFNGERI
jgi:hypothetical protein